MEPTEFPSATPKARTSVAAIMSLVCGLLGCIPFVTGLAAVILGIVGIKKTKDPMVTGKGLAIAGLILGVLSLAGSTAGTLLFMKGLSAMKEMGEPARLVAEQFTRNVSEGKIDEALALSEGMDRAAIEAQVEKLKPLGAFQDIKLIAYIPVPNDEGKIIGVVTGLANFATGPKSCTIELTKKSVDETFKVTKFEVK